MESVDETRRQELGKTKARCEGIGLRIKAIDKNAVHELDEDSTSTVQKLLDGDKMPTPCMVISLERETLGKLTKMALTSGKHPWLPAHIIFAGQENNGKIYPAVIEVKN